MSSTCYAFNGGDLDTRRSRSLNTSENLGPNHRATSYCPTSRECTSKGCVANSPQIASCCNNRLNSRKQILYTAPRPPTSSDTCQKRGNKQPYSTYSHLLCAAYKALDKRALKTHYTSSRGYAVQTHHPMHKPYTKQFSRTFCPVYVLPTLDLKG